MPRYSKPRFSVDDGGKQVRLPKQSNCIAKRRKPTRAQSDFIVAAYIEKVYRKIV